MAGCPAANASVDVSVAPNGSMILNRAWIDASRGSKIAVKDWPESSDRVNWSDSPAVSKFASSALL